MDAESLGQFRDADTSGAGCSHSVHFRLRQPCSRASPWLCGSLDQRVIRLAGRLDYAAGRLIPRGNKPLDPWSPVPAALDCVHTVLRQ